jgi:leader peptidase (prepilin peptidase) / N-methyltransferase
MLTDLATLYSANLGLFVGSVFVLSLVVGSFLNVVIYRLPIMLQRDWQLQAADVLGQAPAAAETRFTLSTPRSACPHCKAPITALQNIPLISWIVLRGRCASCKHPISVRYPLVELATGLLSAIVAWHFGFGPAAACGILITWVLVAMTGIDLDHQLLPDNLTLPLMWAGFLAAILIGPIPGVPLPVSPRDAILGAVAGYMSLWSVFHIFRLITGKEGMGYGDFKLFAALGAWLGWQSLLLIILLSAATGAILGILMILLRGRERAQPMPFGPYLAAAGYIAMLYGDQLVSGYLRVSGLKH